MSIAAGETSAPRDVALDTSTTRCVRAVDGVALAALLFLPLVVLTKAVDPFRQPKVLLLHAAGIVVAAILAAAVTAGVIGWRDVIRRRLPDTVALCVLGWSAVTALFAAHRPTALFAVLTAASVAAIFFALRWGARERYRSWVLLAVIVPGLVNAAIAIAQRLDVWNALVPFADRGTEAAVTGLLGNPNDVGAFLVPCLVAAAAWLLAARSLAVRALLAAACALLLGGIVASHTRGAILGAGAGLAAMVIARWGRAAALRLVALGVIAALALATHQAILDRLFSMQLEALVSGRVIPFAAAWRMFVESPFVGVGPGCFGYAYFDYATKVYPALVEYSIAGRQFMFAEAHNDHLQILAETGAPGYLLFLAALVTVARVSFRAPLETERGRLARCCGAPLAVSLFFTALFQFPLYLAAPLTAFAGVAALTVGWSER